MNMKRVVASFLILLLFAGCKELSDPSFSKELTELSETDLNKKYVAITARTINLKSNFKDSTGTIHDLDSLANLLHSKLVDSVFQFWYDTPWDFNGVTETPKKGKIACGYFVSTTLKQCGFNLQRVKLAQQASSNIIASLCDMKTQKIFTNNNFAGLESHLKNQDNGLYIIGLDNHVAFISIEETGIFAIHSSPPRVKRQKLTECSAITKSKYFVVANFSHNKEVLKKWINNEKISTKL
jgi:hypothetical protein